MTVEKFKYRLDKRTTMITWITLGSVILIFGVLWFFSFGDYLPAWFFSITTATIALCVLSIPRSIRLGADAVEIRCVVEITHIPYDHIKSVRRIGRAELRPIYPVFASMGFFGYFGYYLDPRSWNIIKVYATSWHGLVMIEDIYEQRYLVSAEQPDMLCDGIRDKCTRCRSRQQAAE